MLGKTIYKWVVAAWLMLWGSVLSVTFGQTYGSPYREGPFSSCAAYSTVSTTACPTCHFKSTSAYTFGVNSAYAPQVSEPFSTGQAKSGARRSWGDPDDYGVGEIADPLPIGEPWVLLLLAALYVGYLFVSKHNWYGNNESVGV